MGRELETAADDLSPGNVHRLILYDAPASPCSRRCRITMLEMGLDWDTVNLNLALMEQRNPQYLAINPNGLVPALAHGERVVVESAAINTYLEDQFPEVRLMPGNSRDVARVRMWQASELAMARVFRPLMYALNGGPIKRITRTEEEAERLARRNTDDAYDIAWEKSVWRLEVLDADDIRQKFDWLRQWLGRVETALQDRDYLVGDEFSPADIAVYPRLEMFQNVDLDIPGERYPNVRRWMDNLAGRDSIVDSVPEAARRYTALVRSEPMKMVRDYYFRTDTRERTMEQLETIREFGRELREQLGVDAVLNATGSARSLPTPRKGGTIEPGKHRFPAVDTPSALLLYGSALSPHSHRIELLLQVLQRRYRYVDVDIASGENLAPWFLALNPLAEVPVLVAGDFPVFDSAAIAEYLCDDPDRAELFVPASSVGRANLDGWLALETGGHKEFAPLLAVLRPGRRRGHATRLNDKRRRLLVSRSLQRLEHVEAALGESAFLLGEAMSYADLAWYSRIRSLRAAGVGEELRSLAAIGRWIVRLDERLSALPDPRTVVTHDVA